MSDNQLYLNFDEYIRQGEPLQKEKALNWETAIGLQAVDLLTVSDFLLDLAIKNIEGELSMDGVTKAIRKHYSGTEKDIIRKEYCAYTKIYRDRNRQYEFPFKYEE